MENGTKQLKLSDREKDKLTVLSGMAKASLSRLPILGEIIAGRDAYETSKFQRNIGKVLYFLQNKVENLQSFFSEAWLQTEEGKSFSRKVFDSALDAQMEDKQELFINALINGVIDQKLSNLEKLKFVDMLRHLSLAALNVLAEMHNIYKDRVRYTGLPHTEKPLAKINVDQVVEKLGSKFYPYLIESVIKEMEAVGLFSPNVEWHKDSPGRFRHGLYFPGDAIVYTEFTAKFVEFITLKNKKCLENKGTQ